MKRASAVGGLLALIAFWVGTPCFAEDLSKEVEQLRATVHTLTERVQKQEQQIDALEKTLKGLTSLRKTESDTARSREKKGHTLDEILSEHENSLSKKPLKSWKLKGWKNPSNWTKLKRGMTRSQVRAILGPPTSVESKYGTIEVWNYEGNVPGSGEVIGNVNFMERRMVRNQPPVF